MKEWIKEYYNLNLYTLDDVAVFVSASWITAQDYEEITGEPYVA